MIRDNTITWRFDVFIRIFFKINYVPEMYSDSWLSIILYKSTWKCGAYSVHCFLIWTWGTRVITIFQTRLQSAFTSQFTRSHSIILTSIIKRKKQKNTHTTRHCPKLCMDYLPFICVQNISNLLQKGLSGISSIVPGRGNPEFIIHLPKVICMKFIIHRLHLLVILVWMSKGLL